MKMRKLKIILTATLLLAITASIFSGCTKKAEPSPVTSKETTINTEVQAIAKSPEELAEAMKDVTPVPQKTDDELITATLLNHYDKQFSAEPYDIKSTGYKMYLIEDVGPGLKRAYGWANYWCYNIENGEMNMKAGSGITQVALEYSTDGKVQKVIYEVLTDDQVGDAEFNKVFPESIRPQLLKRDPKDMEEVDKMQKDMAKRLYKEKTGKEYTKPL